LALNADYAKVWPNITRKGSQPGDAEDWKGREGKEALFSPNPGKGS